MSTRKIRRWLLIANNVAVIASAGCQTASNRMPPAVPQQVSASEQSTPTGMAKTDFHREISRDQQFNVHVELAKVHESQGNNDAALAEYEQAIAIGERRGSVLSGGKLGPEALSLAYRRMGATYDRMGRFVLAENQYGKALKLSPNDPRVLNDAGYSYYLQNRLADAERSLKTALSFAPNDARILTNLGLTLAVAGKTQEALVTLGQASGPAIGHANLGFILAASGRTPEARKAYETALSLQPELAPARQALAKLDQPGATAIARKDDGNKTLNGASGPVDPSVSSTSIPQANNPPAATNPTSGVLGEVEAPPAEAVSPAPPVTTQEAMARDKAVSAKAAQATENPGKPPSAVTPAPSSTSSWIEPAAESDATVPTALVPPQGQPIDNAPAVPHQAERTVAPSEPSPSKISELTTFDEDGRAVANPSPPTPQESPATASAAGSTGETLAFHDAAEPIQLSSLSIPAPATSIPVDSAIGTAPASSMSRPLASTQPSAESSESLDKSIPLTVVAEDETTSAAKDPRAMPEAGARSTPRAELIVEPAPGVVESNQPPTSVVTAPTPPAPAPVPEPAAVPSATTPEMNVPTDLASPFPAKMNELLGTSQEPSAPPKADIAPETPSLATEQDPSATMVIEPSQIEPTPAPGMAIPSQAVSSSEQKSDPGGQASPSSPHPTSKSLPGSTTPATRQPDPSGGMIALSATNPRNRPIASLVPSMRSHRIQPALPSKTNPRGTVPGWAVPKNYREASYPPAPSVTAISVLRKNTPQSPPSNMVPPTPW